MVKRLLSKFLFVVFCFVPRCDAVIVEGDMTLFPNVLPMQIDTLTTTQVRALTTSQLTSLSTAQIQSLTPGQIAAFRSAQIVVFTAGQIAAFTTTQVQAFTVSQVPVLTTTQIQALTEAQIAALTTTQVQVLTLSQMAGLTLWQVGALTDGQIAVLTIEQRAACSYLPSAGPQAVKYGDAIFVQHKNYGTYLEVAATPVYSPTQNLCCAITKPTGFAAQFFIEAATSAKTRFASVGQPVLSGDVVRLESVSLAGAVSYGRAYGYWLSFAGPTLVPNDFGSTYFTAMLSVYSGVVWNDVNGSGTGYRLYKHGGVIGDPILTDDSVYFVSWGPDPFNQPRPMFLGSANTSYVDGKKAFIYRDVYAGEYDQPPLFVDNYLWTLTLSVVGAYQGAPAVYWSDQGFDVSGWPTADLYQW